MSAQNKPECEIYKKKPECEFSHLLIPSVMVNYFHFKGLSRDTHTHFTLFVLIKRQELPTKEGSGMTREREGIEILQALREPTSPFHIFPGINRRNVRFRSQKFLKKLAKALFSSKGFRQCSNEYRSSQINKSMHQTFQDPCKQYFESISLGKRCKTWTSEE